MPAKIAPQPQDVPPLRRALPRTALRIAVLIAVVVVVHMIMGWLMMQLDAVKDGSDKITVIVVLGLLLVGYALLIAVPFMPGIEIGIALLMLQGASIAPFVYGATIAGLTLAYTIGRAVPLNVLHDTFRDLRMHRASKLVAGIMNTPDTARLNALQSRLPRPVAGIAVKYRYVMLGALINIPGSFAVGGGGGIMMLAGIVRLFRWPAVLVTLVIATLPIPLAVYLWGPQGFSAFFG